MPPKHLPRWSSCTPTDVSVTEHVCGDIRVSTGPEHAVSDTFQLTRTCVKRYECANTTKFCRGTIPVAAGKQY